MESYYNYDTKIHIDDGEQISQHINRDFSL